jgi:hypothetical protein
MQRVHFGLGTDRFAALLATVYGALRLSFANFVV